jgi:hypothetical protein
MTEREMHLRQRIDVLLDRVAQRDQLIEALQLRLSARASRRCGYCGRNSRGQRVTCYFCGTPLEPAEAA